VTPRLLLELGRTSNLPTVWSNVLAGALLSGAALGGGSVGESTGALALCAVVASLFYVGGMLLNDAFDAELDARERPERPIPSGRVSRAEVLGYGFGLLSAGAGLLVLRVVVTGTGLGAVFAGAFTAAAIVAYDLWHKGKPWSPIVMGLCRAGVYAMAALSVAPEPSPSVWFGALSLLLYVVGLTHVARFETRSTLGRLWPALFVFAPSLLSLVSALELDLVSLALALPWWLAANVWAALSLRHALAGRIPRAVVGLIAGISLVDAMTMASHGARVLPCLALVAFGVTLGWQRKIRGT